MPPNMDTFPDVQTLLKFHSCRTEQSFKVTNGTWRTSKKPFQSCTPCLQKYVEGKNDGWAYGGCTQYSFSNLDPFLVSHLPQTWRSVMGKHWNRVVMNTTIVKRTSVSQIQAGCQEQRSSSSDWPKNRTEISKQWLAHCKHCTAI